MKKFSLRIEGDGVRVDRVISYFVMGEVVQVMLNAEAKEEEEKTYQREEKKQRKIRSELWSEHTEREKGMTTKTKKGRRE